MTVIQERWASWYSGFPPGIQLAALPGQDWGHYEIDIMTNPRTKKSSPIRCLVWVLLSSAIFIGFLGLGQARAAPNLVLIIADDMAWEDVGAYGHPTIQTPNLDRLAAQGMRFDSAFVTISSCSPSRASIITGRYPHNTGAEELHWPLPANQITFVQLLREAGYWTAAAGKWHLGDAVRDHFDQIREIGSEGFVLTTESQNERGPEFEAKSGCDQWVPLLKDRPADQPFFLWLAALDPHRDYDTGIIPRPHTPEEVIVPPYLPDVPATRKDLALYYDEISRLDRYVGAVVEELEQQGVAENTLVLFISDNGRPFPRAKTTLYDSGIKTPWIVRWPARVRAGDTTQSLVSTLDIAPTFLEMAGLNQTESFQGESFLPILTNPKARIRDHVYAEKNWHDYTDHARAVRSPDYKYIRNYYEDLPLTPPADAVRSPTYEAMRRLLPQAKLRPEAQSSFHQPRPGEELYKVESDPEELNNLAEDPAYSLVIREMRAALAQWELATDDEWPRTRTPDEFDRSTGEPLPNRRRPRPTREELTSPAPPPSVDLSRGPLRISKDRRHLEHGDGTPFFYLGDTAWELFHRLSRKDTARFLENRRSKGFTVIQAVILAELDGLHTPNLYGHTPLLQDDPTRPNEEYFKHVDWVIDLARRKGIYIGLLPTWGDKVVLESWGKGPVIFNASNAETYGRFLGRRYRNHPNIIWILGGDRKATGQEEIWRAMARGIREGDGGSHLMSYHPQGGHSSSEWFHQEDWLDFNMLQSGHSALDLANYSMLMTDYQKEPVKPCMDAEPRYENIPIGFKPENGRFQAYDLRQAAYWALLSGALGHTYGCNDIWQMFAPGREPVLSARRYWYQALDLPGAFDMQHLRNFFVSRPFESLVPDQDLLAEQYEGKAHLRAARGQGFVVVYTPAGNPIRLNPQHLPRGPLKAWWFNPRTGRARDGGTFPVESMPSFNPPGERNNRGNDWLLIVDASRLGYPPPGRLLD